MAIKQIRNFTSLGLNVDMSPSDLEGGYITRCENVRSINGGISPFGGSRDLDPKDELAKFSFKPRSIIYNENRTEKYWIIIDDEKILKSSSNITDVTPDGMPAISDKSEWSETSLSGNVVINNNNIGPYSFSKGDTKFIPLQFKKGQSWHDANQSAEIIVSYKQILVACNIQDNGVERPDTVRWSTPSDVGELPTTWDPTDTAAKAGIVTLGGNGGPIIGALQMRDSLMIYRTRGITVMDAVGGKYLYQFRHLNSNAGLLTHRCVVDVNGKHYFISDGDIYVNDGNTVKSIAHNKIRTAFSSINKDKFDNAYAVHNTAKKEVLFMVPSVKSEYPDLAYVYNYEDDSWFIRNMPPSIHTQYGLSVKLEDDWNSIPPEMAWDRYSKSWADDSTTPFDYSLVSLTIPEGSPSDPTHYVGTKLIAIDSLLGFNTTGFNSIIERTDFVIENTEQVKTINAIYPHIKGSDIIMIQLGSQKMPGGAVQWKQPRPFRPGRDRKVDIRSTGALHAYRIYANDVKAVFSITGLDFNYVMAGER